ncbi:F-box protein [Cardamine amara subsp. amara]|uniref:F-box protein n=1 Tax=Cardamine amara subsp. amara TaxID=228776 RepID=A0ABD1AXV9_CARAN
MGNYNGKLTIILSSSFRANGLTTSRISMWVLVDAAKHEWSKKDFVVDVWMNEFLFSVKCLTDAGEFVLSPETTLHKPPFRLVFYDPKKNAVRRVFIKGITERKHPLCDKVYTISIVPCQVENLMFL